MTADNPASVNRRLFHGGTPGLRPGERIEPGKPHYIDGCAICEAHKAGAELAVDGVVIDPANHEPDRVFVTTDREYARFYASKYVNGDLYTVAVSGELRQSDKDPFPTWHADRVFVRGVAERCVRLTDKQRRRLSERWRLADARR